MENVVAGLSNNDLAAAMALNDESMYRKEQIEALKQQREQLQNMSEELSQEELDQITAGEPHFGTPRY